MVRLHGLDDALVYAELFQYPPSNLDMRALDLVVDGVLKGGMFADGQLLLAQTAPLLALPRHAIRVDAAASYVFIVQDGVVAKRAVTVGEEHGNEMNVITAGLSDAAQVIVAPLGALKAGARVKIAAAG